MKKRQIWTDLSELRKLCLAIRTDQITVIFMYWMTGIIGLAALVAPYLLGFADMPQAFWTSVGFGGALIALSVIEGYRMDRDNIEYWAVGLLGVGLLLSPFLMGFSNSSSALWTSIIMGVVTVIVASTRLLQRNEFS